MAIDRAAIQLFRFNWPNQKNLKQPDRSREAWSTKKTKKYMLPSGFVAQGATNKPHRNIESFVSRTAHYPIRAR
jgi:hypothetical protein